MSLVTVATSFVVLMLLASVILGWIADLKRTGGAVSAQEARAQADRAGRASFYTSREDRTEAMRERIRRERRRRERARAARAPSAADDRSGDAPRAGEPRADRPSIPPPDAPEVRHREVLELGPGPVTMDTLRHHYRRLVVAYHPDRVAGLGVKLQRLAEEETKAINQAYAFFKRRLEA